MAAKCPCKACNKAYREATVAERVVYTQDCDCNGELCTCGKCTKHCSGNHSNGAKKAVIVVTRRA